jgi:hypothetical protein
LQEEEAEKKAKQEGGQKIKAAEVLAAAKSKKHKAK